MKPIKRATVLVHYDRDDIVDAYLYPYIQALQETNAHLIFVSTAKLSQIEVEKLSLYCDKVILRDNVGYDFMSYKVGLESFAYQEYDEVLLCNDSVYGPLYPMSELFAKMDSESCDFWGITDNIDMGYHIQSYFILLKQNILESPIFEDFWQNVEVLHDKDEIIKRYEIGFSQALINAGFTAQSSSKFQPTQKQKWAIVLAKFTPKKIINKLKSIVTGKAKMVRLRKINTTHYFWKELLLSGDIPFVKIELLRDNPLGVNIKDFEEIISSVSSTYDSKLITKHLTRMNTKKLS